LTPPFQLREDPNATKYYSTRYSDESREREMLHSMELSQSLPPSLSFKRGVVCVGKGVSGGLTPGGTESLSGDGLKAIQARTA
jgi:hypothetical protein